LGKLEFGDTPEDWPTGIAKCDKPLSGAYGMFDHINLFGDESPDHRPVVVYAGEAPIKGFSSADVISCGILLE
jgi:hypothetical protein